MTDKADLLTLEKLKIAERMGSLETAVALLTQESKSNKEQAMLVLQKHTEAIYGNSHKGLLTRTAINEQKANLLIWLLAAVVSGLIPVAMKAFFG